MIIRRYLVKQVVSTSLVVVALLTLIMMGGRLIKYFGVAAQGRLDATILFSIIGYRLPEFLTLILPLGFFIGLMLVFGRLYVDHEMAVLNGSGVSKIQLARLLIPLTIIYLFVQSVLMIWMSPWGIREYEKLVSTQAVRTGFDLVRPKEFISSGPYTIYAGSLSDDRKNLKDIFFYQRAQKEGKPDVMILAKEATRVEVADDTANVVDLLQGRRYEIFPGTAKYTQAEFQSYRLRLENDKEAKFESNEVEALSFSKLLKNTDDPVVASELGWRIFVPFSMIVALMLATALSEVSPRQGRYLKLFPALLIFASLIVALMAIKTRMSKGEIGIWAYPAVLLFYAIGAALFSRKQKLAPKIKKQIQRVKS
ncbi:LPS export ABC transporter permease LptF [Acinetobacter sichuanensis]|uniref:Lipopolysaccharide export system permease protein LptF n=1 Tax=Acinetobacter sichuanensis TaxID=2136183 RepID=A0A371YPH5_9GAMM|nr:MULTISPECIES: LPS export ABC transporter permease LptF [Acinetobacter]MDM1249164.1 LPS export ABC transporter permease LptF [Acinetobacter sp. R933-2]MDM1765149.1 LPS export ABC transporter permease LptF [Acinetobacter sp. 226-1]MDM1768503.1 LPS export ABC transporter permease LptF [Acinetobacter sp. 226-4]RFC83367.1 LPS export ABC transporter permease LptF [Acinetobacter sichuanensis]